MITTKEKEDYFTIYTKKDNIFYDVSLEYIGIKKEK